MANANTNIIPIVKKTVAGEVEQGVDARALYEFLGVDTRFGDWFSRRIEEYGFIENQDFIILLKNEKNSGRGRKAVDYFLTLEMAKELAMVEKNEKGKEARRYFIECERRLKQQPDPEFLMIHKSVLQDTGKAHIPASVMADFKDAPRFH